MRVLQVFLDKLKITVFNQNKERIKNKDGYVNIPDSLVSSSALKKIKENPRTKNSFLEVYAYKALNQD